MLRNLLLSGLVLFAHMSFAQNVGINSDGSSPASSAALDVDFDDKGLLIPRVALLATNNSTLPVPNPAISLLVYNTADAGIAPYNVVKGYYFWNGTVWSRLATGNGSQWNTNGTAINYQGSVGINTTTPTQALDITGNLRFSGTLMPGGSAGSAGSVLTSSGTGAAPTWQNPNTILNTFWTLGGNAVSANQTVGTSTNFDFGIKTSNIERVRVLTSGRVGIGTSTPEQLFDVNGTAVFGNIGIPGRIMISSLDNSSTDIYTPDDKVFRISNVGVGQQGASLQLKGSADSYLFSFEGYNGFRYFARNTNTETFKVTNTGELISAGTGSNSFMGNLGIKNATPTQALDITGNLQVSGAIMPGGNAGLAGYVLTSSGAGAAPTWQNAAATLDNFWTIGGNNVTANQTMGTSSNFDFGIETNDTERIRISRLGNVGVGTTSPASSALLDLTSTTRGFLTPRMTSAQRLALSGPSEGLLVYQTDLSRGFYFYKQGAWSNFGSDLSGWTLSGGSVSSTGNVGIGIADPTSPLHVASATSGNLLYLQNTLGGIGKEVGIAFKTYISAGLPTATITAIDQDYSTHIRFSTKTPGADGNPLVERLRISNIGSVIIGGSNVTEDTNYKLKVGGNIYVNDISYANGYGRSDRNLKTNIVDLNYGLQDVLKLRPVAYNWKVTPEGDKQLGLIAQEVITLIPEIVKDDGSANKVLGVNYTALIPVLINAIKEQQIQIDELKKQGEKNQELINLLLKAKNN